MSNKRIVLWVAAALHLAVIVCNGSPAPDRATQESDFAGRWHGRTITGGTWELELRADHRFVRRYVNRAVPSESVTIEGTWSLVLPPADTPTWRDRLGLSSPGPVAMFARLTLEYTLNPGFVTVRETYLATATKGAAGWLRLRDPRDPFDQVPFELPRAMPGRFERAK